MSFDVTNTLNATRTHLAQCGYFKTVQLGELRAPPTERSAGILLQERRVAWVTGNTTVELHTVIVRIYTNPNQDPVDQAELDLANAVDKVWTELTGDFDLGGTLQAIDVGGIYGEGLRAKWGWQEFNQGGGFHRIVDIVVPMIVNDPATLTP